MATCSYGAKIGGIRVFAEQHTKTNAAALRNFKGAYVVSNYAGHTCNGAHMWLAGLNALRAKQKYPQLPMAIQTWW